MFLARKMQKMLDKKRRPIFAWVIASIFLGSSSCALLGGGSIPVQHADGYRLFVPSGWHPIQDDQGGADHSYRTASGNLVEMNSACHHLQGRTLKILTRELLIGERNVTFDEQREMEINGFPALYSRLSSTLDGVEFHLQAVVVEAHDCVFDFTLMGEKPPPEKDVSDFMGFVRTFKYGKN